MSKIVDHFREAFRDRAFVLCAGILLLSAVCLDALAMGLQLHFRKLPVPLRKSLDQFDEYKLWPYKVVQRTKLPSEMEGELGTDQYIQWLLEDTSIHGQDQPGKYVTFFVTYYTGTPDQVPHVPEECYVGGGYDRVGGSQAQVTVPNLGLPDDKLDVHLLLFKGGRQLVNQNRPVIYLFSVNGKFTSTRLGARLALADIRSKYAYLSKVEITFQGPRQPSREQALQLAGKLLSRALPELVKEHWPAWPVVEEAAK